MTYLLRCNSDVTSLLSGTAIKAVVAYVSDYITKWSLNTHVIFDVIRVVLTRNSELISGSATRQEKARRLVTQMVNLLSVRMELGAPMICMYLLDNPDHYTSHKFKPFHWSSYVTEVEKAWNTEQNNDNKVVLIKKNGRIFGLSQVYDYVYRPSELENMTLYDWIRRYMDEDRIDSGLQHGKTSTNEDIIDENSLPTPAIKKNLPTNHFPFIYGHPLADSHAIKLSPEDSELVPNFIGPGLPRRDKGNRECYCMTMLVFFKPWRSGRDLKQADESWDNCFINHNFIKRYHDIMNNFQLRYECLDSRDDF
ncbi:hypothetical protein K435DRAFT_667372, partial [Dendrothele bispora CBS 962.96]